MQLLQSPDDTPDTATRRGHYSQGKHGTGKVFIGDQLAATGFRPDYQSPDQSYWMRQPGGVSEEEVKDEASGERD